MQRSRAELKSFFKKNAIPTQSNFEDLIESGLNQKDDGVAKAPDDALTLQGAGAEEAVLRFTRSVAGGGTPAWLLKLNPTGAPKTGLAFQENGAAARLFIQTGTGNIGIGTVDPKSRLHVDNGRVDITASKLPAGGGLRFDGLAAEPRRAQLVLSSEYSDAVIASSQSNDNHGSTLTFVTTNPADATQYRKFVINQGNWGARQQFLEFGYVDKSVTNPHQCIGGDTTVLTLDGINRRVGVGTRGPCASLEVLGSAVISTGARVASPTGLMNAGSLTLGGTDLSFGGGFWKDGQWNSSKGAPALLLETLSNTEIAVHDSNTRLASLMYFEGDSTNRITLGRDMGWGPIGELVLNGKLRNPMWRVTQVYNNKQGPLPLKDGVFESGGGTLLIISSGSGYKTGSGGWIGMGIKVDGIQRGSHGVFCNEITSHRAFAMNPLVVAGVAAGSHTLELVTADAATDGNDRFSVTVVELPF